MLRMNEREGDYIHVLTRVRSHLPLEGGYWNHGSDKSLPVVRYTNPWYGHMSTDSTTFFSSGSTIIVKLSTRTSGKVLALLIRIASLPALMRSGKRRLQRG